MTASVTRLMRPCVVCEQPTDSTVPAVLGVTLGVACVDCAYWSDGNLLVNLTPEERARFEGPCTVVDAPVLPLVDDRPSPKVCECPHAAHRPAEMFAPSSRFHATGSGPGHAAQARIRLCDAWVTLPDVVSPRVCEDCHRAGHLLGGAA